MAFLTDRKRAAGMGATGTGTQHHWSMTISSVALLVLVPVFIFTFGGVIGEDYATLVAYFGRPFPALVTALTIVISMVHFKGGVTTLIEDYVHGLARKVSIIVMTCVSYGIAAVAVFALARLAL